MSKRAEELKKDVSELRAQLEDDSEITEEERVILGNIINQTEAFLTPLVAFSDHLETLKPPAPTKKEKIKKGLKLIGKFIGLP